MNDPLNPLSDEEITRQVRARQLARAKVMALLLGAFVVLVFAISIVRMGGGGAM